MVNKRQICYFLDYIKSRR